MRWPLNTWCGSVLQPIEPAWRCTFFTPCEARWPWNLCRFMTPAVPRPLLVPTMSTAFTCREDIDFQFLADLAAVDGAAEFANEALRFAIGFGRWLDARRGAAFLAFAVELGDVAASGAAGKTAGFVEITKLDRFVAVARFGPHLQDVARPRLKNSHRDDLTGGVENLRHPDLAAE